MNLIKNQSSSLKSFLRDLGWSGTGIGIALATDFGFYIITGRLLGPELFGLFGVFMAIYYVTVGPLSHAIEVASKKMSADNESDASTLVTPALKVGAVFWIIFVLSIPIIKEILSLPLKGLIVFSLVFPFAYVLAVLVGVLQGKGDYRSYAYYEIFSSVAKFTAIGLIALGLGLLGAILAPVMEIFAGLLVTVFVLKPSLSTSKFTEIPLIQKSTIFILAIYASFSIDIFMLKIFMNAETVGIYNSVATLGKAIFFGSVAINRAVFPKFVENPSERLSLLHVALSLILLGGGFTSIVFALIGSEFIALTFGAEYVAASSFAPLYMIFITSVSAVSLLGNYYISSDKENLYRILLLPLLEIIGIYFFHSSISQILYVTTIVTIATFVILYLPVYLDEKKSDLF